MKVYCIGMSRSGGTLQFLLTRDIVKQMHGKTSWEVTKQEIALDWVVDDLREKRAVGINIYRDFRDVTLSLWNFFRGRAKYRGEDPDTWTFEEIMKKAEETLTWQKKWEEIDGIYSVKYEDIHPDRWADEVVGISSFLGLRTNFTSALELASKYSLEENKRRIANLNQWWDGHNTLLTQVHIGKHRGRIGQWLHDDMITSKRLAAIEELGGDWLKEHGYGTVYK